MANRQNSPESPPRQNLPVFCKLQVDEPYVCDHRNDCLLTEIHAVTTDERNSVICMTLPPRLLSIILCCVMALGYAPAWLHVATCDGHHASERLAHADSTASCGCNHSHEHGGSGNVDLPAENSEGTDSEGTPDNGHNSESCPVCQSLSNANGVGTKLSVPPVGSLDSWPISQANDHIFAVPSHSTVQTRGPPAVS